MILCYFNDKTRVETEIYIDRSGTAMCVLGGRRGFEMHSVARQITLENILRSVISHQIH